MENRGRRLTLSRALETARPMMARCVLCPRECRVNRLTGERGFCKAPYPSRVFYLNVLYGEEMEISPSCEVFTSGCNMRCSFCYAKSWVDRPDAKGAADIASLKETVERAAHSSRSLSFVGGEPTVNLLSILELLQNLEIERHLTADMLDVAASINPADDDLRKRKETLLDGELGNEPRGCPGN